MSAIVQQKLMLYSDVDEKGCWNWTRALTHNGYGFVTVSGKQYRAARVSHEVFVGPIPAGLQIDHLCRNPKCVNPVHLEAITQQENIRRSDGIQARNARKTHCKRGHAYTPENTIAQKGGRRCRTCTNEQARARRKRSMEGSS